MSELNKTFPVCIDQFGWDSATGRFEGAGRGRRSGLTSLSSMPFMVALSPSKSMSAHERHVSITHDGCNYICMSWENRSWKVECREGGNDSDTLRIVKRQIHWIQRRVRIRQTLGEIISSDELESPVSAARVAVGMHLEPVLARWARELFQVKAREIESRPDVFADCELVPLLETAASVRRCPLGEYVGLQLRRRAFLRDLLRALDALADEHGEYHVCVSLRCPVLLDSAAVSVSLLAFPPSSSSSRVQGKRKVYSRKTLIVDFAAVAASGQPIMMISADITRQVGSSSCNARLSGLTIDSAVAHLRGLLS